MSIFSSILSKIIPSVSAVNITGNIIDKITHKSETQKTDQASATTPIPQPAVDLSSASLLKDVDVVAILNELASKNPQKLNWKTSIVDLLKLLGLDSSLDTRKKLATELNYTGDTNDSASMNIWLIKAVMKKIAEKGGNVKDLF